MGRYFQQPRQGAQREPRSNGNGNNASSSKNAKPKLKGSGEQKCAICHTYEREWTWQPAGPSEDVECVFTEPGHHYRAFPAIAVCGGCHDKIVAGKPVEFLYKGKRYGCETVANDRGGKRYEIYEL